MWQLQKMGSKEAWLDAILSHDRMKPVYKHTESCKEQESISMFLGSL